MFEKCIFRMKQDLERVSRIYNKLYDCIDNRELFKAFDSYLRDPLENGYYIDFSTDNEVCLKSRSSKNDMYHILITPSLQNIESIAIKIVYYDGRHEENIIAQFKNDEKKVVLTKRVVEKIIQGKKKEVVDITNNTTIKSYLNDELRYDYAYTSETCFRLHQNYSKSSLSETFIDSDNNAVRRVALITEDDFYQDPATITYYETNHFEAPPFKDRDCGSLYRYSMSLSTKEKFDEFISNKAKAVTLKR